MFDSKKSLISWHEMEYKKSWLMDQMMMEI